MKRSKDRRFFSRRSLEATPTNDFSSTKTITPTKTARAFDGLKVEDVEDSEHATPMALPPFFHSNPKPSSRNILPTLSSLEQPIASMESSAGFLKTIPTSKRTTVVRKLGPEKQLSTRRSDSSKVTLRSPSNGKFAMTKTEIQRKDHHTKLPAPMQLSPHSSMVQMDHPIESLPLQDTRKLCKLEGCSRLACVEGTRVHDYCCRTHSLLGTRQNEVAPVVEDVCRITRPTRDQYNKLSQQFLSAWVKGHPPLLESISVYIIINTALERKWHAYRDLLSDTTIETHYHGTKLCCNISSLRLCNNKSCGICGIAQNNFDHALIGSNISRFKRFGDAFYLAPNSSKCHDYTVGYGQHRAMLCFQTLPGRKYTLKKTNVNFVLPSGYDSAYGEPGQSLNYPELLLYKSEAALPVCIFMYKKDGIEQIAK